MTKLTISIICLLASMSLQAAEPARPLWMVARDIIDESFDDDDARSAAASALVAARAETPQDPNLYVQAARLTVMRDRAFPSGLRPGSIEAFTELLDKALAIDPSHKKALILRATAYRLVGDLSNEKGTLERAARAPGIDRWLFVGWAQYARSLRDYSSAYYAYEEIEQLGPGESVDQRNAYVYALGEIANYPPPPGERLRVKDLSELAKKYRSPKDYESPARFARHFLMHGLYAEAVESARESLRIRKTTDANLTLAAALNGVAAIRKFNGDDVGSSRLALEAKGYGFSKVEILQRLSSPSAAFSDLLRYIDRVIQE